MEAEKLIRAMNLQVLTGSTATLTPADWEFFARLAIRALSGEDYLELVQLVSGLGAYPMKGSPYITNEIENSLLFQIAMRIVQVAGTRQGLLIPDQDEVNPTLNLLTVATVAKELEVSRAVVNEMLRSGRLRGKRVGRNWIVERVDLDRFRTNWRGTKRPNVKGKEE